MKRLTILALAALFVLGSVMSAAAAEIEATGDFRFQWVWSDNLDFANSDNTNNNEDDFDARQRFRCQIDITQSENLRGVLALEIGTWQWGNNALDNGGIISTVAGSNGDIEVRRAFIDFNVPETDLQLRVGKFGLGLPTAVAGNPILNDENVTGILATYPINDMFAVAVVWARAVDLDTNYTANSERTDEMDVFGIIVPVTLDYFTAQPYFVFASAGTQAVQPAVRETQSVVGSGTFGWPNSLGANSATNMYWAGLALDVDYFDPLTFGLDVAWGTTTAPSFEAYNRDGWYIAARADYRLDFMTPGLVVWWASGNDDDFRNGDESIPFISGSFAGTTIAFDGSSLLDCNCMFDATAEGTWGIALLLQDISFVEDLTHTFRIAYVQGTDDEDWVNAQYVAGVARGDVLATTESVWEIDLNTTYMIYENLSLVNEIGWAWANFDEDARNGWDEGAPAVKLGFGLQYTF